MQRNLLKKTKLPYKGQVFNAPLQSSIMRTDFTETIEEPTLKGRLIESTHGAYLRILWELDVSPSDTQCAQS